MVIVRLGNDANPYDNEWREVEFEVNSKQAMINLTRSFRDKFKDVIRDFELIPLYNEYRYNFFPRDMLSGSS